MRVVGLTGGIGCGKSTVAAMLRARGVPVIDADQLGRDVVAPGTPGLQAIVDAFGAAVLRPDGALDRKGLAAQVFPNPVALARLNAIVHPLIQAAAMARLRELAMQEHPLVVLEAALLLEAGWDRVVDTVVVVTTTPELQLQRLVARGDVTPEDAQARVASQLPLAAKEARADHLIRNDGDLDALEAAVEALLRALLAGASPKEDPQ